MYLHYEDVLAILGTHAVQLILVPRASMTVEMNNIKTIIVL